MRSKVVACLLLWAAPQLAVGDASCPWPRCLPKCEHCPGTRIESCWGAMLGISHGCGQGINNTECFLGSCLCKSGFCAHPDPKSLTGGVICKPAKCDSIGESNPPLPARTVWLKLWVMLTPDSAFPAPAYMEKHYMDYVKKVAKLPLLLCVLGLIASFVTAGFLCCGCTGHHFVHGKKSKYEDDASDEEGSYASLVSSGGKSQKDKKKPGHGCLVFLAVFIIIFTIFAVTLRSCESLESEGVIRGVLDHMHGDATTIKHQAVHINTTVHKFLDSVHGLVHECAEHNAVIAPLVGKFQGLIDDDLRNYKQMVTNYSELVAPYPAQIKHAEEYLDSHNKQLAFAPNIPLIFLAVVCLIVLGEGVMTFTMQKSGCSSIMDHCLRLSVVVFILIILCVTASLAIGSTIGITLGHFCEEPDLNTMTYAKYFSNSTAVGDTSSHYLSGQSLNPARTAIQLARKYVKGLDGAYKSLHGEFTYAESKCPAVVGLNLTTVATEALTVFSAAEELLSGTHVWPFYRDVVRHGVCQDFVRGLGLMVIFQVLIGLIIFPICTIVTHKFLVQWSDYEAWKVRKDIE